MMMSEASYWIARRFNAPDAQLFVGGRLSLIHEAMQVLQEDQDDRAEQVQLIFSRQYEDDWREKFDLRTA